MLRQNLKKAGQSALRLVPRSKRAVEEPQISPKSLRFPCRADGVCRAGRLPDSRVIREDYRRGAVLPAPRPSMVLKISGMTSMM